MLGNRVVVEGLTGSASLGDHSEVTRRSGRRKHCLQGARCRPSTSSAGPTWTSSTTSIPAAASAAGLVAHDGRLGQFDAGDGARARGGAPVGGRRGRRARGRRPAGRDRPDRAAGRDPEHHLPAGARAAARAEPDLLGQPSVPGPLRRALRRHERRGRRPGARGARAAPGGPRRSSTPRASTLDEPPSVFVDSALAMLGGGGELVVQLAGGARRRSAGAAGRARAAAAGQALEALKRFGTALRDEIEPDADPHAFAIGEEQFARRLHFEHARRGRRARALALRTPPAGGDHRPSSSALAAELGPRPWRELVDELRNDAPDAGELLDVYREELDRARDVRGRAGPGGGAGRAGGGRAPRRRSSRRWCRSRPTSRRRSISAPSAGRFYVTPPDPSLPAEVVGPAAARALPPRHPGDGGARGLSGPPPPARHRAGARARRCGAISGRRSWSRAGRSTASSSWARRATTGRRSSGCSSW